MTEPLPRSWVRVKRDVDALGVKAKDVAVFGRLPGVGTKGRLRLQLMASGWSDVEVVDNVLATESKAFDASAHLVDLSADGRETAQTADDAATALRKDAGFDVKLKPLPASGRSGVLWRALTALPWWTTSDILSGHRTVILVGSTSAMLERVSAAFVRDLWKTLGGGPTARMPAFRRMNLLTRQSHDALDALGKTAEALDLLVMHGGHHHDGDSTAQVVNTLLGVRGVFPNGLLVYEMVVDSEADFDPALRTLRRNGFSAGSTLIVGVKGTRPKPPTAAKKVKR